MRKGFLKNILLSLTALALVCSCSFLFPQEKETTKRAAGYKLQPPADWKSKANDETDYAYELPSGLLALVTSNCVHGDAPTDVLTRHLLIGSRDVQILEQRKVQVDGVQSLFSKLKASLDGVAFNLEVFVVSKGGCVFDFSLLGRKAIQPKDSQSFARFVQTFHFDRGAT